ncbi:hypothetical protein OWR28_13420 [Chryseobacterium sp. 1B4]
MVSITRIGSSLLCSCTCDNEKEQLCTHQAEIIHCIIEDKNYRLFFDDMLRKKIFLPKARGYGLENEADLDQYFELQYTDGRIEAVPKIKEMLPVDDVILKGT